MDLIDVPSDDVDLIDAHLDVVDDLQKMTDEMGYSSDKGLGLQITKFEEEDYIDPLWEGIQWSDEQQI